MALDDVYQCSVVFTSPLADGDIINVLHYQLTIDTTPSSELGYASAIASEVEELYRLTLMPLVSDQFTLDRVDVFNLNQPLVEFSFSSGTVGGSILDTLGPRNAIVVSKKTGLRGRSFRGRVYILPPLEQDQNGGDLSTGHEAAIQSFVDDMIILTIPNDNEYQLVVYSPTLSTPPGDIQSSLVITMTVRKQLGTIRGRKVVRG